MATLSLSSKIDDVTDTSSLAVLMAVDGWWALIQCWMTEFASSLLGSQGNGTMPKTNKDLMIDAKENKLKELEVLGDRIFAGVRWPY